MGKIPRIKQGALPSAVVGVPAQSPSLADDIVGAVGKLAEVGYGLAVKSEAAELKKMAAADKVRRGILDDISFGKRTTDFVVESGEALDKIYADNLATPERAAQAAADWSDAWVGDVQNMNETEEVRGAVTKWATSAKNAVIKQAATWGRKTETANAKIKFDANRQETINSAEKAPSVAVLGMGIAMLEKDNASYLGMYGAEAEKEKAQTRTDMSFAYASANLSKNPLQVLSELEAQDNALSKYLDTTQRNTLRSRAKTAVSSAQAIRTNARNQEAAQRSGQYTDLIKSKNFTGEYVLSEQRRIDGELLKLSASKPNNAEYEAAKKTLDTQRKDLDGLAEAERNARVLTPQSDMGVVLSINERALALFGDEGQIENVGELRKFQSDIIVAFNDKKLTMKQFLTMSAQVKRAFPEVMNTEWDKGTEWWNPNTTAELGINMLNKGLESKGYTDMSLLINQRLGVGASDRMKSQVMFNYSSGVEEYTKDGAELTKKVVERLVKEAFTKSTGITVGFE